MPMMKAVRLHAYGGPEVLRYEEAPRPEAGPGEVLVKVHSVALNPIDWKFREGYLQKFMPTSLPLILSWDVSGTVESLGEGVEGFAKGDPVFGLIDFKRNGAQAEFATVKASGLIARPKAIDDIHAAALPLAGLTAYQALFSPAGLRLSAGQTVLIHGAAGGVGHFAVQLAKWKGAKVVATGSARNVEFLRGLGADEVIDYNAQKFEALVRDVDGVLDSMGGDTQARSWGVIKDGGALAGLAGVAPNETAKARNIRATFAGLRMVRADLETLTRLVLDKTLRPEISEVLPLAEARTGLDHLQAGHTRGKIVLRVV